MKANAGIDDGNAERIEEQGDFELGRRSIPGSLGQIALLIIFVAFTEYPRSHPVQLATCAGLILATNLLRLFLGLRQRDFYPGRRKTWTTLFAPTIWASALAWSILFFGVIRSKGLMHYDTTVSLLIGSGTSASIITSVSPNRRLAFAFITLMLGIPLIAVILSMSPRSMGLALIFVVYHAFLSFQLSIHHKSFWEGIRNRARLVAQRNRLQTMVDAIPGLVSWIGPDLRYRGVNRNYALNYGGTTGEFLDRDLGYKNQDEEFLAAVRGFAHSPSPQAAFEVPLTVGATRRWHLLVARKTETALPEGGQETYLVCIDIHDFKQAQSELEQQRIQAELASKLATLGEITANVAHELRNPLSVIFTSAELMQKQIQSTALDPARLGQLIERILATSTRLNKLIEGLKGFSRKTEGEPYVIAHLNDLVRDSVDLVGQHFRNHRISLQIEPIDPSLAVSCRPIEISQVLVNLLTNALDAARSQEGKWVRLKVSESAGEVRISVIDSGPGIPAEIADRIFAPFFTTKPANKGTGLGLSISRRILERHGGSLELDRSAEHTTFVVRLPAVHAARKSA